MTADGGHQTPLHPLRGNRDRTQQHLDLHPLQGQGDGEEVNCETFMYWSGHRDLASVLGYWIARAPRMGKDS